MINRYIVNQQSYIQRKMKQPLTGFTNPQGQQANWGDIAVTFKNTRGINQNFYFNNTNKAVPKINMDFTEDDYLNEESHQLLFAYLLDLLRESTSFLTKKKKLTAARQFLGLLGKNPALMSIDDIQCVIDSMKLSRYLTTFFRWLHENHMIPSLYQPHIQTRTYTLRDKSGDDAILGEKSKLPDEKSMLALGAIFYDVIPPYSHDKTDITAWGSLAHSTQSQRDVFTCTMSALAMASPNRAATEQVILSKQRLQSKTEIVDGEEKTVNFLNWRGSKGYLDNQKHFNIEMAESLDRALHFTGIVTEPARVLARFYENPQLPLDKVLGEFKPSKENLSILRPSMRKPTSLIHLGLLLGFYDESDKTVRVTKDTQDAIKVPKHPSSIPKYVKHIVNISPFDKLIFISRCPHAQMLIGIFFELSTVRYTNCLTIILSPLLSFRTIMCH
ncbi:hypothetical protein QUN95_000547 [Vibrio parahaemolyticus]|nr:hypothetical protein [Vibrio parahaemolyticus]EIY6179336.1 hypothetical protein [Vibrio parahaemolyticus]EKM6952041.1 hypothetical protein [Vibrio parahaemolyticus]ELA9350898.1 hypothetical protein [Vibrio parahaemolyticus]ELA9589969.1 hypothetical protein [Vibrio parahaemolyticus]